MKKHLFILLGIALCLFVGFLSRLFHEAAMVEWYPMLVKSPLTPPDIVFPIVWGVIYVLMGIALGLLYGANDFPYRRSLLRLFAIQLLLNLSWNYMFFYMQDPTLGLINLLILDILAVVFYFGALQVKRNVAYLFLPYLLWMLFATYLNVSIVMNN